MRNEKDKDRKIDEKKLEMIFGRGKNINNTSEIKIS